MYDEKITEKPREFFIDNIRIYLTVLVILHHIAIGYGGHGGWSLYQNDFIPVDMATTILFTIFTAINQSYFMSMFFLFAGYFTVQSYSRKGSMIYLKDRILKFGVPILFYSVIISPYIAFLITNKAWGNDIPLVVFIDERLANLLAGINHLWFLFALLLFSIVYVLFSEFTKRIEWNSPFKKLTAMPSKRFMLFLLVILVALTFIIRLDYAIGDTILYNFQIAHFTHYISSFCIGILAYQGGWFKSLDRTRAFPYILVTLIFIPIGLLFLLLMVDTGSTDPFGPFIGGFTLESILYVIWESVALISISVTLVFVGKKWVNKENRITRELARSTYTAYIIHPLIIIMFMIPLLWDPTHPLGKFVIVSSSCLVIFGLSFLIRQIPYAKRILG